MSAVAAAKTADTSDCSSGAINGICIGMASLCVRSVLRSCYRLVTAFMAASAYVCHPSVCVQRYTLVTELLQRLWSHLLASECTSKAINDKCTNLVPTVHTVSIHCTFSHLLGRHMFPEVNVCMLLGPQLTHRHATLLSMSLYAIV